VRNYKSLANAERVLRSLKTIDLRVRPVHHRLADRVRAHILLCMLAYYVEWHLREAWREMMFADTEHASNARRRHRPRRPLTACPMARPRTASPP